MPQSMRSGSKLRTFLFVTMGLLSVEDKDLLQDWELILCDMSTLESVALLPRLSRSFDRMKAVVVEHSDKLKLQKRMSLVDSLESSDMQCIPMCCFCALFLKRHLKRLSAGQIAEVAEWERDFCVTETELVGKFLEMLQRREADLKMLNATCVEQLFSGHLKKTDADLRFGYDFVRRSWTQLSLPEQKRVQQALQHFVVQVEQIPAKSIHEPKLFVGETVLWETSCHAPDCLKVCDSCMVTAWMQNLELCLSCIVQTK